jgi:hypothetical protein
MSSRDLTPWSQARSRWANHAQRLALEVPETLDLCRIRSDDHHGIGVEDGERANFIRGGSVAADDRKLNLAFGPSVERLQRTEVGTMDSRMGTLLAASVRPKAAISAASSNSAGPTARARVRALRAGAKRGRDQTGLTLRDLSVASLPPE